MKLFIKHLLLLILLSTQSFGFSNNPPVANAGPDITTTTNTYIVISGSATDGDGDSLTYKWENSSGQVLATSKSFVYPTNNTGTYTLTFIATDPEGDYDTDKMSITINLPYGGTADGVCYDSPTTSDRKTTTPINSIDNTLENVIVYFDTSSLISIFGGGPIDDCSVDNGAKSVNCEEDSSGNSIGPVSMFNNEGWTFSLGDVSENQDRSISTYDDRFGFGFFDFINSFFSITGAIQATYEKNGYLYKGEIKACAPPPSKEVEVTTNLRDFTIRNPLETRNIKGNIQVIGNTVLCVKKNGSCYNYKGNSSNANLNLQYIDTDGDQYTYNSSQAKLELPAESTIVWAGFYSQGYLKGLNKSQSISKANEPTRLSHPVFGTLSLTPDNLDLYPNDNNGYTYSTFTDVPALVGLTETDLNGWITGANIKSYIGTDRSGLGNFGAWTFVVIYENESETLKNISIFDGYRRVAKNRGFSSVEIPITDFLTPSNGDVKSTISVFAGEGDKNIGGDKFYVDNISLNGNNAFNSATSGFDANPDYINNQGIDIQNYNIGTDGDQTHPQIIQNDQTSAVIKLTSSQDTYFPSMVGFTTELYIPRVCYYIDTIVGARGNKIFDDGEFIEDIESNTEYTFNFWISNMKKEETDTELEAAKFVQIYLNMQDFDYTSNSSSIYNLGTSGYQDMSDSYNFDNNYSKAANDLGEYISNNSTWRVGYGANTQQGGILNVASGFNDTPNIVKVKINGQITTSIDAQTLDLLDYLEVSASFKTDTITIDPNNALRIEQCQDLNTSATLGQNGLYNAVQTNFTYSKDPINDGTVVDPKNYLKTQVVNKPFTLAILSLDRSDEETLVYSTKDVNVSIIATPSWTGDTNTDAQLCHNAVPLDTEQVVLLNGLQQINATFNSQVATKNASIKIKYSESSSACSRDVFAIRPDRFILTAPAGQDIELLTSARNYNLSLDAVQFNTTTPVTTYNVPNVNNTVFDINQSLRKPDGSIDNSMNGTVSFLATQFNIINGSALNAVGLNFDDVGNVIIQLVDKTWAQIDIANNDTTADCSPTGAYVCGDINATFIPANFLLNAVTLHNNNNGNFTYISNDLSMSAHIQLTATAVNDNGNPTRNFTQNDWENPVDITMNLAAVAGMTSHQDDVNQTRNLNFQNGVLMIPWNEAQGFKQMMFNFQRANDAVRNPLMVRGTDVNVTASSVYTSSTGTPPITVTGSSLADQNTTFVYGRTNAPRQMFQANIGTVPISYESYCFGAGCDKTMLPGGVNSTTTNDPRWFVNNGHDPMISGNTGVVNQRSGAGLVTNPAGVTDALGLTTVPLIYNGASFPYKTTMQNNASTWLIYNQYNAGAGVNEFEVEFTNANTTWAGQHETNSTTATTAAQRTNRRAMW